MSVSRILYKHLTPYFKSHNFKKIGNCYFKIENDIAFCFTPEFVSHVRLWCYILPLYMPFELRYLTYGAHIEFVHRELQNLIPTHGEISDKQATVWMERMARVIENEILPFFQTISSPELLLQYCGLPGYEHMMYLRLPYGNPNLFRLQGYTAVYLGEKEIAKKAIENYRESTLNSPNTLPFYIERDVAESYELEKMLLLSEEERTQRMKDICSNTLRACFMPHNRKTKA